MNSTPTPSVCPPQCALCNRRLVATTDGSLNDISVCNPCIHAFAFRRATAWLIDNGTFQLFNTLLFNWLLGMSPPAPMVYPNVAIVTNLEIFSVLIWVVFLFKDGFSGYSLGKRLMGLRVIDVAIYKPIGFLQSIRRNLPTLIPFSGFVMMFQMLKGPRWGDKMANTRVVWLKHQHKPPFDQRGLLCAQCGYDLTGNTSGRCSECGTVVPASRQNTAKDEAVQA